MQKSLKKYEQKNNVTIKNIFEFHSFLKMYEVAFSEMYTLCSIVITIPVSSAACERTFSCMKRVKNYLRNSINNDLMSSLSIISIEKNEAKQLIIDDVIKAFSDGHKNRRILLK